MRALWIILGVFVAAVWDLSFDHGAMAGPVYEVTKEFVRSADQLFAGALKLFL